MRTFAITISIATLLALAPARALAQDVDERLWLSADAEVALDDDVALELESQFRFGDDAGGHYESIFGAMVTIPAGAAELGVGYQTNRTVGADPARREHRLRQQLGFKVARIGRGTLSARLRTEERWRNDGDDVHFRLRPAVSFSHPLGSGGAKWSLGHESFIGTSADWNRQTGWFRMRNRIGVAVPVAQRLSLSAGYLNQYEWGREGRRDSMAHVLTAGVSLGL